MNDCTTCKHIERNPEDQPCANCSRLLDRAASPNYYEPEETQTKHTSGQLRAVGSDPDTDIAPVIVDRDGNPVAEVPIYSDNRNGHSQGTALAVANAERLALAWNCHDELLAACEALLITFRFYFGTDDCRATVMAKAAIALAKP